MDRIDLSGRWRFCLDKNKSGIENKFYEDIFSDFIDLPTTVSEARKGLPSNEENASFLTDPYHFEGYTWYSREVSFSEIVNKELFLVLERTRTSHVWIDSCYIGSNNSLCTSHRYRITPYIKQNKHRLTIMVDNTSYPIKGGHMTSPDTQTNWNGITGQIYIEILDPVYLTGIKIYPDARKRQILVKATLVGADKSIARIRVVDGKGNGFGEIEQQLFLGQNRFIYELDKTAQLWSEHSPHLYHLHISLASDVYTYTFGLRDFKAVGKYLVINGKRTFLRGKHDGLIFPMTGYAPTDLESWIRILSIAKSYGINHYRFHTCCPPEAAFAAADLLGIYMEPELPFWGTITIESDDDHDEKAQQYLIQEGYRILDEFGNHPSFVMMSLGNELWGSKETLNEILEKYKKYDNRHLYTQGSNNFQFAPSILENEDFFCGVRFSKDRLFRGSYAMCDAPQGHIQTMPPNMIHNYNDAIRPRDIEANDVEMGEITIQYGTGVKTIAAEKTKEIVPHLPVISHEIGQYAMYPDFSEISKYTGALKARNLEIFRRRLEKEGMLSMAESFFKSSGRLSAECYKAEIETALRSSELAGFQLLDLQDFTGQGTALVGILNSFMENKGLISEEEWREFCSDIVILATLAKLVFVSGEELKFDVLLSHFGESPILAPKIKLSIYSPNNDTLDEDKLSLCFAQNTEGEYSNGIYRLCSFAITMPEIMKPITLTLNIQIEGTNIRNHYDIWLYPNKCQSIEESFNKQSDIAITHRVSTAIDNLKMGKKVLLIPKDLNESNSIQGTYCTDFWCYPMFRSISESMNKPVPIGTLGLCINDKHPVFSNFPTKYYTTPQWYDIVTNSRSLRLNGTEIHPLVWTIDNFERNNRLGLIFEANIEKGKLLVCGSNLLELNDSQPAKWLLYSILSYMSSEEFNPVCDISLEELKSIFIG